MGKSSIIARDSRVPESDGRPQSLICAPLRAGERTAGVIVLASDDAGASYSAADLKLLNTMPCKPLPRHGELDAVRGNGEHCA